MIGIDSLSDDLLCDVLSYLPKKSCLPTTHVCKSFQRCWIQRIRNLDKEEANKDTSTTNTLSTNPFIVGQLYQFDWDHPCYSDALTPRHVSNNTAGNKKKRSKKNSILMETNSKRKVVDTLNRNLLKYYIVDMGWITNYRSLLQRKLMTRILIMAAQRGDIDGMKYIFFELEPIELRTRLCTYYCTRQKSKSFLFSTVFYTASEEEGLTVNEPRQHRQEENDDEEEEGALVNSSSPVLQNLDTNMTAAGQQQHHEEEDMENVTFPIQELCLVIAAAGHLKALHWLLHSAFHMTWVNQKDGMDVYQEATNNDHAHVAKYIMLTMTAQFAPSKSHKKAASAQLDSLMNACNEE